MSKEKGNTQVSNKHEVATLAGGCFWCLEAVYKELRGVTEVISGYSGGHVPNPNYRLVITGTTGHAEVVQLKFDPEEISFEEILKVFFSIHDPTTKDRQGSDIGPQYRSAIFYHTPDQKASAEKLIEELEQERLWNDPIVTELSRFTEFYPAEEYHQEYYARNPWQPYCQIVLAPKIAKFRKEFMDRLKV
jgi:peptide-methionine (S)-S-oxide reductase